MKNDISKQIKALEKKRDAELKKIKASYDAKIKVVIDGYKKDNHYGDYEMQFDLKKKCVVSDECGFVHKCKPCNKWSKKSDWFTVEIEDYDVYTTYTDCGYGDYDEHAMFRVIKRYEVCPNCGRMIHLSTEKFERGESKTRWENAKGFDIRPLHWTPRVKIIKKSK